MFELGMTGIQGQRSDQIFSKTLEPIVLELGFKENLKFRK